MKIPNWNKEKQDEIKAFLLDQGFNPFVMQDALSIILEATKKLENPQDLNDCEIDAYTDNLVYLFALFSLEFAGAMMYIKKIVQE